MLYCHTFKMPKKIDIQKKKKRKKEKATKGCRSLTDISDRLVRPHFTIIILITQAVCGT